MHKSVIDISSKRFDRLVVISFAYMKNHSAHWSCICDCGNIKIVDGHSLRRGHTKSCGCLFKDSVITHNMTSSPEYTTWISMRRRCNEIKHIGYKDYGGRGIKVCEEWNNSFEVFLKDMGKRPSIEYSIDRIDPNKNYCRENCRWATKEIQNNNKRSVKLIEYKDKKLSITQWCRELNLPLYRTRRRFQKGWSLDRVFNPVKLKNGPGSSSFRQ